MQSIKQASFRLRVFPDEANEFHGSGSQSHGQEGTDNRSVPRQRQIVDFAVARNAFEAGSGDRWEYSEGYFGERLSGVITSAWGDWLTLIFFFVLAVLLPLLCVVFV